MFNVHNFIRFCWFGRPSSLTNITYASWLPFQLCTANGMNMAADWMHAAVAILCFLCTITTRFEYELKSAQTYYDYSVGRECTANEVKSNSTSTHANGCKLVRVIVIFFVLCWFLFSLLFLLHRCFCIVNKIRQCSKCAEESLNCFLRIFANLCVFFPLLCIWQIHKYSVVPSIFSQSDSYQNFFYYPSTFFGTLLPFVMLTILNGFLIWTVRKHHKMRHTMTNRRQVNQSTNQTFFLHERQCKKKWHFASFQIQAISTIFILYCCCCFRPIHRKRPKSQLR